MGTRRNTTRNTTAIETALRIAAFRAKQDGREVPQEIEETIKQEGTLRKITWNVMLARTDDVEYVASVRFEGERVKDALAEVYRLPAEEAWGRFLKDCAHLLPDVPRNIRVDVKDVYRKGIPINEQAFQAFITYVEFCVSNERSLIHPILLGIKPVIIEDGNAEIHKVMSSELSEEYRRLVAEHRQGRALRLKTRMRPRPNEATHSFVERVLRLWAEQ